MKKFYFYGMVIVCLFCTATIHAQTNRFWVRAAGNPGDWNDMNNWSTTAGGLPPASVPNGAGFNANFTNGGNARVNAAITLNRLVVTGATTVQLIANTATSSITVNSGTAGSEGLSIAGGSTLEMNCAAAFPFDFNFANNSRGVVSANGTWLFTGAAGVLPPDGATFNLPAVTGLSNQIDIFGTVRFNSNTRIPSTSVGGLDYLFFRNGSTYWLDREGGASPHANWESNATIRLTGVVNLNPIINVDGSNPVIGNLVFNCPGMLAGGGSIEMQLNGIIVQGSLDIQNTNNQPLTLLTNTTANPLVTVNGNVNISGNSRVHIGEDNNRSYTLSVGGNFNLSAGNFLMQMANGVGANSTTLALQGNLNFTGGTFGITSTDVSATNELFVVEMNGTTPQTITAPVGVPIDNTNNMLTLRLNNAAGVSLSSPVSVGKISWNSANKGILTTTAANYLTIRNPDATAANVVNAPANNGYVSGPVRRLTNSTGTYYFPTGKSGLLRNLDIIPATTAASEYSAEYFRTAHSDLSVLSPLTGVTNVEYWNAARIGGTSAAAAIRLSLNGAIAGAGDGVVVAGFNGSDWVSVRGVNGTVLTPGNSTSGFVLSDQLPSFNGDFTLGFGPAGALPIDLVSFEARKLSGNAALLNWSITASSTPDRFEILRSTDGNNFTNIGTVQGADQKLNYDYTDNNLPAGTTYYRLRMIDKDGDVKLSHVVVVTNGTSELFLASMAPTVVIDRARIKVTSAQRGNLQLVITDMYGRIIKQQINGIDIGTQEIWLNLHALASGAYQITGYLDGKRSASLRFIKQ